MDDLPAGAAILILSLDDDGPARRGRFSINMLGAVIAVVLPTMSNSRTDGMEISAPR